MRADAALVTSEHRGQLEREGCFVLDSVIPADVLDMLRDELDQAISAIDAELATEGLEVRGLNHRGRRYFVSKRHLTSARLQSFLFSDLTADICRATIGPDAYLFVEQFVAKMAEVGTRFSWHQDSGYVRSTLPSHSRPYLTLWCALDDMSEENGTVHLLPYSAIGTRHIRDHVPDPGSNDLVGYDGDAEGVPVVVPAGSIAVFESTVFHRSGPNTTGRPRRSYVVQYSPEPILWEDGSPWSFATPFLRGGERLR